MSEKILRLAAATFAVILLVPIPAGAAPKIPLKIEDIAQLRQSGWKLPNPPYPAQARLHHEQGIVYVRMTTDAHGKIAEVAIPVEPKSVKSRILRKNALNYAIHNWSGPPNSTAMTVLDYRLL